MGEHDREDDDLIRDVMSAADTLRFIAFLAVVAIGSAALTYWALTS